LAKPIRPVIVVQAIPEQVDKGQVLSLSARFFDKMTLQPMKVSRIFMSITSEKDGKVVWPLEVVRKDADGFDIMVGTEDMQADTTYLVRVSNNWNLSPSASTTFSTRKKTTILPILPIFLIPTILIQPQDPRREVESYIFRTQMDHRVCPRCKFWENRAFEPQDPDIPKIPIHPNCRCTIDVVYKNPEQVTEEMRSAARAVILMQKEKEIVSVISQIGE
jgi:hypothetical protein